MRLKISEMSGRLALMLAFVVLTSIASHGQGVLSSNIEVAAYLGVVGGIGSHGTIGGSVGAPVSDPLILSGDFSFIPTGGGRVTVPGASTRTSSRAFNFNGNLQYQFKPTRAVVPYAGAGLGLLRSSFEASSSGLPGTVSIQGSSTNMYFNVGGGMRYYVRERWGLRPEHRNCAAN